MSQIYDRPAGQHRTEIIVLKSRFITTMSKATSVEIARAFINDIRDEMPDASHHVYAFRVGYGNTVTEGMSDDGEPSGTSGPPTLAVVRGSNLGDIVVVTTRYFGGTKLGTGGLVRAYSDAVRTALDTLPIERKAPKTQVGLDLPYHFHDQIERLTNEHNGIINDKIYASEITLIVTFLRDDVALFEKALLDLTHGQVELVHLAELDD